MPGEVIEISKNGLHVCTKKGILLIKQVHPESSKPMDAKSFSLGRNMSAGDKFL